MVGTSVWETALTLYGGEDFMGSADGLQGFGKVRIFLNADLADGADESESEKDDLA